MGQPWARLRRRPAQPAVHLGCPSRPRPLPPLGPRPTRRSSCSPGAQHGRPRAHPQGQRPQRPGTRRAAQGWQPQRCGRPVPQGESSNSPCTPRPWAGPAHFSLFPPGPQDPVRFWLPGLPPALPWRFPLGCWGHPSAWNQAPYFHALEQGFCAWAQGAFLSRRFSAAGLCWALKTLPNDPASTQEMLPTGSSTPQPPPPPGTTTDVPRSGGSWGRAAQARLLREASGAVLPECDPCPRSWRPARHPEGCPLLASLSPSPDLRPRHPGGPVSSTAPSAVPFPSSFPRGAVFSLSRQPRAPTFLLLSPRSAILKPRRAGQADLASKPRAPAAWRSCSEPRWSSWVSPAAGDQSQEEHRRAAHTEEAGTGAASATAGQTDHSLGVTLCFQPTLLRQGTRAAEHTTREGPAQDAC